MFFQILGAKNRRRDVAHLLHSAYMAAGSERQMARKSYIEYRLEPRRLGEPSELTHGSPITSDEHIKRGARSELMPAAPNTNGAHGKRGEPNGLGPDRQIFS
jgi:hypothetical protein